jgi:hypothetical protein
MALGTIPSVYLTRRWRCHFAPGDGAIAEVDLLYGGLTSTAVPARVAPGIFTLSDGSAAIQHSSDYSLVTPANPAGKGEVVIVYLTGLRQTCFDPSANLGDILYAGPAPGYSGWIKSICRFRQILHRATTS